MIWLKSLLATKLAKCNDVGNMATSTFEGLSCFNDNNSFSKSLINFESPLHFQFPPTKNFRASARAEAWKPLDETLAREDARALEENNMVKVTILFGFFL